MQTLLRARGALVGAVAAMSICAYHCRTCGAHFTSLGAFDGHREGPAGSNRVCSFPDSAELVELTGTCKIGDPTMPSVAVTIYSTERAARARDYFNGTNARQTLSANAKPATAA